MLQYQQLKPAFESVIERLDKVLGAQRETVRLLGEILKAQREIASTLKSPVVVEEPVAVKEPIVDEPVVEKSIFRKILGRFEK